MSKDIHIMVHSWGKKYFIKHKFLIFEGFDFSDSYFLIMHSCTILNILWREQLFHKPNNICYFGSVLFDWQILPIFQNLSKRHHPILKSIEVLRIWKILSTIWKMTIILMQQYDKYLLPLEMKNGYYIMYTFFFIKIEI